MQHVYTTINLFPFKSNNIRNCVFVDACNVVLVSTVLFLYQLLELFQKDFNYEITIKTTFLPVV